MARSPSTTIGDSSTAAPRVKPSADWKKLGTTGFRYLDREGTPDGIFKMTLKASNAGKVKLALQARGPHLTLPAINHSPTTRVQLRSTTSGVCWESGFAD